MTEICGEIKDLWFSKDNTKLNLQLVVDDTGCPIIIVEEWTPKIDPENDYDSKELFRMHLKEAIELKSILLTI